MKFYLDKRNGVIRDEDGTHIAEQCDGASLKEMQLLAAAPELLEVLQEIVGQDRPNTYGYDAACIALEDSWRKKARAAIKKATE
jgi:hypothetical protein